MAVSSPRDLDIDNPANHKSGPGGLANVLTMGDPNGVGPIIAEKAWRQLRNSPASAFFILGDISAMPASVPLAEIDGPAAAKTTFTSALPVLHRPMRSRSERDEVAAIAGWIEEGAALALAGEVAALITNPISKVRMQAQGFKHAGHTEFLAALTTAPDARPRPVMMLVGGGLRVALATIHVPLAEVPASLDRATLNNVALTTATSAESDFGIAAPALAFAGLNPHAGEQGVLGCEERELINPVAAELRRHGVDIADARPADSVFHEAREGRFDAVIAMYHDQGLIPVKTLDFFGGVNVTLGLPIIRTSPDHGTAFEAAAAGQGHPGSLIAALQLGGSMARRRALFRAG